MNFKSILMEVIGINLYSCQKEELEEEDMRGGEG